MDTEQQAPDLRDRTTAFALRVVKLFGALPKSTEAQVLGKQLLRSGTSGGANYREAHRARSDAEFVSIIGTCLKELEESAYWLELLVAAEIMPESRLAPLQDETNQLTPSSSPSPKRSNPAHNPFIPDS